MFCWLLWWRPQEQAASSSRDFSEKWENLLSALALHFAYYNFCRKQIPLKGATPAMAAATADRAWTISELMSF